MRDTRYKIRDTKYNFAGKNVLVMGLGRFGGGVDVTRFAASSGAKVIVTDLAPAENLSDSIKQLKEFPDIEYHLGSHDPADFEQADVIVVNPAVAPDNDFLKLAAGLNKFITSQIGIFFELCPAPIIGITGAIGKSTTTALTTHLLKSATTPVTGHGSLRRTPTCAGRQAGGGATRYENVWLSGNIGNEPLLTILNQIAPDDLVVLELSSFQIEQLAQIKKAPKIALLTNLTPNHLDRYGTFDNYCAAKENIFKFQKLDEHYPAVSIFNAEDKIAAEWFEKYKHDAGRICLNFSTDDISKKIRDSCPLPGRANLSNLAAALAIARHFGIDDNSIINCLPNFKPLPHRLEFVEQINGASWYNDSKATTPQAAIAALEAFDQPIIIIAGGYDKNIPFDELGKKIAQKVKAAILLGQTAPKISDSIKKNQKYLAPQFIAGLTTRDTRHEIRDTSCQMRDTKIEFAESLEQAVQITNRLCQPGDVVLLSPACASYDMFENYQQRGLLFAKLVSQLKR